MPPFNPQQHHRRSIRLPGYDYTQSGAYFITICVAGHNCILGQIDAGELPLSTLGYIADREWRCLPARIPYLRLDAFVIMPNHVHGILVIEEPCTDGSRGTAETIIGQSPNDTRRAPTAETIIGQSPNDTRRAPPGNQEQFGRSIPGSIPTIVRSYKSAVTKRVNRMHGEPGADFWQSNYFEHVIRNGEALERTREYIIHNPDQWAKDQLNPTSPPNPKNP